jgi:hypothetical protein
MTSTGLPHSEISGSTPVCGSPELIAANHVLHRLLTPRHSPCALSSLATNFMWNPERVPHLQRSLRLAKPAFARSRERVALLRGATNSSNPDPTLESQLDRSPTGFKLLRITTFWCDTPSTRLRPKFNERIHWTPARSLPV